MTPSYALYFHVVVLKWILSLLTIWVAFWKISGQVNKIVLKHCCYKTFYATIKHWNIFAYEVEL